MSEVDYRVTVKLTWVPITERFPRPYMPVLMSVRDCALAMPGWCNGKTWFHSGSNLEVRGVVTHWSDMPLGLEP